MTQARLRQLGTLHARHRSPSIHAVMYHDIHARQKGGHAAAPAEYSASQADDALPAEGLVSALLQGAERPSGVAPSEAMQQAMAGSKQAATHAKSPESGQALQSCHKRSLHACTAVHQCQCS